MMARRWRLTGGFAFSAAPVRTSAQAAGAVKVERSGFVHTPIRSAAWMYAIDKLVSFREVARAYDVKGQEKRRKLMLAECGVDVSASGGSK